ncbi:hypothetical protein BDR03DRAFT_50364 [Suillus americanus]|nr:hypothetical protein BDR03DRAFT_50364 [Suillus americanus]
MRNEDFLDVDSGRPCIYANPLLCGMYIISLIAIAEVLMSKRQSHVHFPPASLVKRVSGWPKCLIVIVPCSFICSSPFVAVCLSMPSDEFPHAIVSTVLKYMLTQPSPLSYTNPRSIGDTCRDEYKVSYSLSALSWMIQMSGSMHLRKTTVTFIDL